MTILFLILTAICAYFLGGINGAIISSRYLFKKDIRDFGSRNAGLNNFYRTFGLPGLVLVLITDVGKSVAAIFIGYGLLGVVGQPTVGMLFAGFCLMLGHFYPAFYQFRGGKGVLCAGVLALMVDWRVGVLCWLIFALVVVFTKYVSLGSILGMVCFPPLLLAFGYEGPAIPIALLCTLAVVVKHLPNIRRLINGTESRLNLGRPKPPQT
jgi:glycerol-3-phosphate acyltransferase PlsY